MKYEILKREILVNEVMTFEVNMYFSSRTGKFFNKDVYFINFLFNTLLLAENKFD